jgi:hypothetical protein
MKNDMQSTYSRPVLRRIVLGIWCLAAAVSVPFALGCSKQKGPSHYDLSGSITFNGRPLPAGVIIFSPDGSRGNKGPGATAEIKDGVYHTAAGQGTIGGPHVAAISGYDGKGYQKGKEEFPLGKPVFSEVRIQVDLPKEAAKHDFILPQKH